MNENILQSLKSESAPCIKLLSLKRKSRLGVILNPKPFHVDVNMKRIFPAHLLVWMKMQIHSLPLGAAFAVTLVTLYTKQQL